jgi:ABC-type multidrug transport system fused ATPase/permease subunit
VAERIILCLTLCTFTIGTYLIWFDKKNVFNHALIGLCFVAYVIPVSILDFDYFVDSDIVKLDVYINLIGSIFFVTGLILGYKWKCITMINTVMRFSIVEEAIYSDSFEVRLLSVSKKIYIVCLVTMALCFIYMGYLPMFAADPYSAKQFKGIYQPRYQHVALFYRTSKQFIQILLPFFLIDFYDKRKIGTLIMILCGMLLVFVSLSRSETVTGLLLIISIIVAMQKSKKIFLFYIVFVVLFFSLGSSFWVIASYYFPNSGFSSFIEGQTAADAIASGAPDILDQLTFLSAFVRNHVDYTYGLTFLGGLIPFNFKWNTSVWTLMVLNDTNDISEIASGGLRLPVSIWGYVCFGWAGVAVVPFFSAFFTGYIIKKIKNIVTKLKAGYKGYMIFYYLVFLYLYIGIIFTDFYRLTIYLFPGFIFYGLILYSLKHRKN